MRYRRAYNSGDMIEFVASKKVFLGTILEWLMDRKRYRVQKESGEIVWVNPTAVLKKVVGFEMTLD